LINSIEPDGRVVGWSRPGFGRAVTLCTRVSISWLGKPCLGALQLHLEGLVVRDQVLDLLLGAAEILLSARPWDHLLCLRQAEQLRHVHRQSQRVAVEHLVQTILPRRSLVLLFAEAFKVRLHRVAARGLRLEATHEDPDDDEGSARDHLSIPR
jgi:hypothetical protein